MTEQNNREEQSRIQPIVDKLGTVSNEITGPLLDAKLRDAQTVDPLAGIVIVNLTEMGTVTSPAGQEYHFYAARILTSNPKTPNFVNPHYHLNGEEPYHIITGDNGEMNLGVVKDGKVEWREPRKVVAGDGIEVQEGEVHSLRNNGEEPMDFAFSCPKEHLIDQGENHPEGDRYFTKDLPNGIPPWYPKK